MYVAPLSPAISHSTTQKHSTDATQRSRHKMELCHEFNLARTDQLMDHQLELIAARVLLQPGEVAVAGPELQWVRQMFTAFNDQVLGAELREKLGRWYRGEPLGRSKTAKPAEDDSSSESESESS